MVSLSLGLIIYLINCAHFDLLVKITIKLEAECNKLQKLQLYVT